MPIKAPAWCNTAVPEARRGWVDPNSGELLVSSRFTQAQVDEFYGVPSFEDIQDMNQEGKIEASMAAWEAAQEVETDKPMDDLESMTKLELEALGREHGVELDRRQSKAALVETMRNLLSK